MTCSEAMLGTADRLDRLDPSDTNLAEWLWYTEELYLRVWVTIHYLCVIRKRVADLAAE